MRQLFTSGSGPHHEPHHHYSFWVLLLVSVGILLSTHFALFQADEVKPHDAISSPDAVLIAVVAAGLVLLGALLHSEVRERNRTPQKNIQNIQKEKPRRAA